MSNNNGPIRVLCVFACLDRGGAETMCMDLYRKIDRSKVQFDFVKHTPRKGAFEDEILSLGGKIYEAPRYTGYNYHFYCNWWKKHLQAHPEHQIIHGHYFSLSAIYFKICKKYGRITVAHSNSMPGSGMISKLRRFLYAVKKVEQRSDYCLACSQKAGKWLFKTKPYTVLNNAIETNKFVYAPETRLKVRAEFNITDDCLVLGAVGRIVPVKNPNAIIEIFHEVHKRNPNTKMLWVGENKWGLQQYSKKISDLGLTNLIIFTGVRPDVNRLLQAMDVFIMPSLYEGLPVAGVEAQAAGLPCFFSDTIPQETAITDLCHFLPLHQPELWAQEILSAKIERRDMSEQIKRAGYDIHTTAEWLEEFYLQCIKKSSAKT